MHAETPDLKDELLHKGFLSPCKNDMQRKGCREWICCIATNDTESRFDIAHRPRSDRRMRDEEIEKRLANIAIHTEAEKALRQCRAYIERLRRKKKLGYTSTPPLWIDKKYLEIYVAKAKQLRKSRKIKRGRGDSSGALSKAYYMVPSNAEPGPFNLLTIAEVAAKSGQTAKKIRYLCLHGQVPYLPGEPRLIDEVDVTKYFERKHAARLDQDPANARHARIRSLAEAKSPRTRDAKGACDTRSKGSRPHSRGHRGTQSCRYVHRTWQSKKAKIKFLTAPRPHPVYTGPGRY
ncbi:hypothetical protein ACVWW4_006615 [Bradyrhizobium sp. LB7.1]